MPRFLLLCRGDVLPPQQLPTDENDELMNLWGAWFERHGDAVDDPGFPFGQRAAIGADGSDRPILNLTGYSVVLAENMEAARELCRDHPFLHEASADLSVQIFELVPV
jgi:hypothetical protein